MSRNIHFFETASAYTEERNSNYFEPWLSYTVQNEEVNYNKTEYQKLFETPLTFEIISSGTIYWYAQGNEKEKEKDKEEEGYDVQSGQNGNEIPNKTIQYRRDPHFVKFTIPRRTKL